MRWKIPIKNCKEKLELCLDQIEKETGFHIINVKTKNAAYALDEHPYYICNFHIMETPGIRYALWCSECFADVKEQINNNETLWTDYYDVPTNTEILFFCELEEYIDKFKPTYGNFLRGIHRYEYIKELSKEEVDNEIEGMGFYYLNDIPDIIKYFAKHPIKTYVYLGRGIEGIYYQMSNTKLILSYLHDIHTNSKYKRKTKRERKLAERKVTKFCKKLKGYECFAYDTGNKNFVQIVLVCRHKDNITKKQIDNANKMYEKWFNNYKHYGRFFELALLEYEPEEGDSKTKIIREDNKMKKFFYDRVKAEIKDYENKDGWVYKILYTNIKNI